MSSRAWIVWVAMLAPVAVNAQPAPASSTKPSHVELRVAGMLSPSTTGGAVESTYSPPLISGTGTGSATQTVNANTSTAWGVDAALRVFATKAFGLEFGVSRTWSVLSGSENQHHSELSYVSLQPPDYRPREFHVSSDIDLADTRGDRRVTTIVVGPVWRVTGPTRGWSLILSGGVSLRRFSGAIRSLAYMEYRMGGHSTLFSSQHRVEVEPTSTWFAGPYAAVEARARVTDHLGLVAGTRIHLSHSLLTTQVRASRLATPDEDVFVPTMDTVRTALEPGATLDIAAARWQAFVGLSLSFH